MEIVRKLALIKIKIAQRYVIGDFSEQRIHSIQIIGNPRIKKSPNRFFQITSKRDNTTLEFDKKKTVNSEKVY
jgi:hypothetical protein